MKQLKISDQPKIINDFLEALRQAAGGASQLTHTLSDPRWMAIRELVESLEKDILKRATYAAKKTIIVSGG